MSNSAIFTFSFSRSLALFQSRLCWDLRCWWKLPERKTFSHLDSIWLLWNWFFSRRSLYVCSCTFGTSYVKLTFTFFLMKFTFLNILPDTCVLSRPTSLDSLKISHQQPASSYSIQTWKLVDIGNIQNMERYMCWKYSNMEIKIQA